VPPASGPAGSFVLRVPILMYHRIVPIDLAGDSLPGLVVPPETFAAQLAALQGAGWRTITMATLANDLAAHVTPPAKTFVITIDDGWYDGYTYALPILAGHGFVATYFVIASRIDQGSFLSSAQLRALVAAGDEIGDHTMDHVNLTAQGTAKLKYEIDAAAARIAQVTGVWPESLAYPSGHEDSLVAAAVAACQDLRIAVIEGHLVMVQPVAPKPGASPAPPLTTTLQAYESPANQFVIPRIRVSPGTTPAGLLAELGAHQ
jgi:peptidoglycan/xylan/chitin deacetylase (PgdA/CDA1 family)